MAETFHTTETAILDTVPNATRGWYGQPSLQSRTLDVNIDQDLKETSELLSFEAFKRNVIRDGNENQFNIFLPVFVYICVLMTIGLPGNLIAFLVYQQRLKKAIARPFLMTLCCCGFLCCAIVMPLEVDLMRRFYDYDQNWLCKSFRFFAYTVNNLASLTLLAIAAERYRIICNPWKPAFSNTLSRRVCYVNFVLSVLYSIPMAFVYGTQTVPIKRFSEKAQYSEQNNADNDAYTNNSEVFALETKQVFVYGKSCSMDDNMKGSQFPMTVVTIYISTIVLEFIILIAFYSQVTRLLSQRRKESMCQQKAESKRSAQKRVIRVTIMAVVLTGVYEICYLPCLTAVCIRLARPNFYSTLSNISKMVFNLCLKSYLLNSAIYPFIYCYYNKEFRKGLFKLFRTFKSIIVHKEGETISPQSSMVDQSHNNVI